MVWDMRRGSYEEVYIDVNSLLHAAARNRADESEILEAIRCHLSSVLAQYQPRRHLFIAADGPAPLSKLAKQRLRRIDNRRDSERWGTFDTQQFTPGCLFMARLERHMQRFFERQREALRLSPHLEVIFSGSAVAGEGEAKIFERIQRFSQRHSLAILAADSDTLLQAIAHAYPAIRVITPPWIGGSGRGDFCVGRMLRLLGEQLPDRDRLQTRLDFVLLAGLAGGDHLPAVGFANFNLMWSLYCDRPDHTIPALVSTTSYRRDRQLVWDLAALAAFMRTYWQSGVPANLLLVQERVLDTARRDPATTHRRIVEYLCALRAILQQVLGLPDGKGVGGAGAAIPLYSFPAAPTVADLAEMDVSQVEADLASGLSLTPSVTMLPGSAAIMMLDLHEDALPLLPAPLRPLAALYQQRTFADDLEAAHWLNEQLGHLDRHSMSEEDISAIYPRAPIRLLAPTLSIVGQPIR